MTRRTLALAALGAFLAPATLWAQSPLDASVRGGPQFVSYSIGGGIGVTISEMAIPIVVAVPIGSRLTMDVGTAYAASKVKFDAGGTEDISGLTDTQIRANLSFGEDWIILTAGVNLPTGQTTVKEDQFRAASYIGNELLSFPIPSMGSGLGTTAGLAMARPWGDWNVGFGASMRYSAEYEPYEVSGVDEIRFQPGNEYRIRLGADHDFIGGRAAVGLTYSNFSDDKVGGGSAYGSGDRWVMQAGYNRFVWGADWTLSAWDVFRAEGLRAGVRAPTENIIAGAIAAGFNAGGFRLEPNSEFRFQSSEGSFIGSVLLTGVRARFGMGPFDVFPSASYAIGVMASPGDTENARLNGFRGALTLRYR